MITWLLILYIKYILTWSKSSPKFLGTSGLALHRVQNSFGLSDSLFIESEIPLDLRTRSVSSPKFSWTFGLAVHRVQNSLGFSDSLFIESTIPLRNAYIFFAKHESLYLDNTTFSKSIALVLKNIVR